MKTLFGFLLLIHGLIHFSYLLPKPADSSAYPFYFDRGWYFRGVGRGTAHVTGIVLTIIAIVGFLVAGLITLEVTGLAIYWQIIIMISSLSSLALLGLFWDKWLFGDLFIDSTLLFGIVALGWTMGQVL